MGPNINLILIAYGRVDPFVYIPTVPFASNLGGTLACIACSFVFVCPIGFSLQFLILFFVNPLLFLIYIQANSS